ncbi:MAG: bifunctional hydroxymethylpyrimidine kinase/phosphomethylpyrimidine kinase [Desulfovibrionaceae bacterium]|nr:bifunctional hydroxymethylpyrimidine kinase/phosphomethylpyrimidine kinase [Desulfovibrionaceae bacterium]
MKEYPCTLTIAGSDSGGGAGVQADLKVMTMLGTFVTTAFTVMTAQNGLGIGTIYKLPVDFIKEQITMVLEGFPIKALKTGMLFSAEIIEAVSEELQKYPDIIKVIDPVCVCATQGDKLLLEEDALQTLIKKLIPLADVLTPNKPEAEALTGISITTEESVHKAILALYDMGAKAVFLKGGHFSIQGNTMIDWLYAPSFSQEIIALPHNVVDTNNIHGTGCATGAAITAFLAKGYSLYDSVTMAQEYIVTCLEQSYTQGKGIGTPNHIAVTKYIV